MGVIGGYAKKYPTGKLTYVGNWYYYLGQRKLLKPPTMALKGKNYHKAIYLA